MDAQAPASAKNLKRTLAEIQNDVDDIKTSLTDHQYNEVCKKLKTAYELIPDTKDYRLTLWHMLFNVPVHGTTDIIDQMRYETYHYIHLEPREYNYILRAITYNELILESFFDGCIPCPYEVFSPSTVVNLAAVKIISDSHKIKIVDIEEVCS